MGFQNERLINRTAESRYPKLVKNAALGVMQLLAETDQHDEVGLGGAIAVSTGHLLFTAHQARDRKTFTLFDRSNRPSIGHIFTSKDIDTWGAEGADIAVLKYTLPLQHTISMKPPSQEYARGDVLFSIGFPYDGWNPRKKPRITPVTVSHWTTYLIELEYEKGIIDDINGISGGAIVNDQGLLIGVITEAEIRPKFDMLRAVNINFFQPAIR